MDQLQWQPRLSQWSAPADWHPPHNFKKDGTGTKRGGPEARYFLPMSIGSKPATADEGPMLILNGTKTLTSSPFWDYPDGKIPFVGALATSVILATRPDIKRQPTAPCVLGL